MDTPRIRVALLIKSKNKILLIQQHKDGEFYWLVPGGGVNFGENLADAITREVAEELCIDKVTVGNLVLCHDSIAPNGSRHVVNLYFEGELAEDPSLGEESNLTAINYFTAEEIKNLDMRPPVNQLLTEYLSDDLPDNPYRGALWKE